MRIAGPSRIVAAPHAAGSTSIARSAALRCAGAGAPATIDRAPIRAALSELGALEFVQVRRTAAEPVFNALIEEHHYLGYTQPVGEHLKYQVYGNGRPVAGVAWSSAARHREPRDRFIGWSAAARRRNIRFVAYNTRFLIGG